MSMKKMQGVKYPGLDPEYTIPQKLTDLENDGNFVQDAAYTHQTLLVDEIPNTVQTFTFASDGSVSQVLHKRGTATVRTDTFAYAASSITETRTLSSGETLTIVTDLDDLTVTVTHSA